MINVSYLIKDDDMDSIGAYIIISFTSGTILQMQWFSTHIMLDSMTSKEKFEETHKDILDKVRAFCSRPLIDMPLFINSYGSGSQGIWYQQIAKQRLFENE